MSRVRNRQSYDSISDPVLQYYAGEGQDFGAPYQWNAGGYTYEHSMIVDVLSTNYAKRRQAGEIIMNPLELTKWGVNRTSNGIISFTRPNWGRAKLEGDMMGAVVALVSGGQAADCELGKMSELSLVKAYAKLNATPVLSGEIASDLTKTVSMLKRPFGSAINHLMKMNGRKSRFMRQGQSVSKANASAWLEGRYGWLPIISDCQAAINIAKTMRDKVSSALQVVRTSERGDSSTSYSYDVALYGAAYRAMGTRIMRESGSAHTGILYQVSPMALDEKLSKQLGLGGEALPKTVWEVVPFSFVADWFTNVGEWISAVTPNPWVTILGSWTTEMLDQTTDFPGGQIYRSFVESDGSTTVYKGALNSYTSHNITVRRVISPSLPAAPSTKMKINLSWKQTADALALSVGSIIRGIHSFRH